MKVSSTLRLRREIAERFIQAATEVGIPKNDDYNGERQKASGISSRRPTKGFAGIMLLQSDGVR